MVEASRLQGNGSVISAAIIIGVASLLSRIVGLVRERVFTTEFGAGDVFDAFVAAFRVPDFIFNLIVIGALSAAFIPLFTTKVVAGEHGEGSAFSFAVSILNIMILVVSIFSILFIIFAPVLVPLIAPGFSGDKLQLTISLSRVMALQPILLAVSFVFSGVLNSYKRFVVYALAPILYNIGIIFGVEVLVPVMGLMGIAWGVVIGAALHALVQLPSVIYIGFRWKPILISSLKDVQSVWRMMVPRIFGLAAQQINLLVVTFLGSGLLAGSIAVFHLANNIQHIPIGIFGIAFSQAAFPTLAEQAARGDRAAFRKTLSHTFRYILFFVIPISAFFFLLRAEIVRVLFGSGAFDWEDTQLTFETFGLLMMSVFAQATIPLLTRAFYAYHDTKTPVAITAVSVVLNITLAFYLSSLYGVQGLAMAFSIAAVVQLMMLLGVLHWRVEGLDDAQIIRSIARIVAATILAAVVVQLLKVVVGSVVNMQRFWGVFVKLFVSGSGGITVYLVLAWLFGVSEIITLKKYMPRKPKLDKPTETPRFSEVPD